VSELARVMQGDVARLAADAAAGDEQAWTALVGRFDGLLRAVAKSYRLASADTEDVVQNTWLRAWCSLDQLRDTGAIAGWLLVTLRREAMRTLQRGVREVLTDATEQFCEGRLESPDHALIQRECEAHLHDAVGRLPGRQRQVLSCLLMDPAPSYEQISERLGMPIGSIGPTRERAVGRLRQDGALRRLVRP